MTPVQNILSFLCFFLFVLKLLNVLKTISNFLFQNGVLQEANVVLVFSLRSRDFNIDVDLSFFQ